jgi:hypothetical protein
MRIRTEWNDDSSLRDSSTLMGNLHELEVDPVTVLQVYRIKITRLAMAWLLEYDNELSDNIS